MTIKTPTSFPYLAIAKRHGLDYGHVLRVADMMAHGRGKPFVGMEATMLEPAHSEILGAVSRFILIQQGAIKPW